MQVKKPFFIIILLFLIINWLATFFSWQNRLLPPEPDDSGVFLSLINSYRQYGNIFSPAIKVFNRAWIWDETGGVDKSNYFSWAFFWGNIAKLLPLPKEQILHISFYFGIVLFLIAILYFFRDEKIQFKTILVLVLTFFTGDGAYHGLFWPTPSLYSVALYLIILKIIINQNKYWFVKLFFLLPIFLLIHPLSLVACFSFPIIYLINIIYKDKKIQGNIFLLTFLFCLLINFLWMSFLNKENVSLATTNSDLLGFVANQLLAGKFIILNQTVKIIINKYILVIISRPFFITFFALGFIKIMKKNKLILKLYISFLLFMILGLFFIGGEKILLYVWIITFFIFAYGLNFLAVLLKQLYKGRKSYSYFKKYYLLFLSNLIICIIWAVVNLLKGSSKDILISKLFLLSVGLLLIIIFLNIIWFKKSLFIVLSFFSIISFFWYLFLEKGAMIIFQKNRNNFDFRADIFLPIISKKNNGIIIYGDNMSYAIFSGAGLIEKEVVKKGMLKDSDLDNASFFVVSRGKYGECQEELCLFQEGNQQRLMKQQIIDANFLLYEF